MTRLTKAEYKVATVYRSCRGAFFINSPSHTAIPQAEIEQDEQARERLREGERRFDKEEKSLISVLHTLLDDQSTKCCFNSKNHISSPVHKLIIEKDAAGQRRRGEEETKARQKTAQNPASCAHVTLLSFAEH